MAKIIIEGCDKVGKTTLAKKLSKKYKLDVLHFNRYDKTNHIFYSQTMKKTNYIFDRHFIGEMIYPFIFNRKKQLNKEQFEKLLKQANDENVKIIVLYETDEVLLKRIKKENYKEVKDNFLKINNMFIDIAKKYNIKLFNTRKNKLKEIEDYIFNENI